MKILLKETISLYLNNLRLLILISLPFIIASSIVDQISTQPIVGKGIFLSLFLMLLNAFIFSALTSTIIVCLSEVKYHKPISIKESFYGGIIHTPFLMFTYILLMAPLFIFWNLSAMVGRMMNIDVSIIFPLSYAYYYIILKASFAPYLIILDGKKPFSAIKMSFTYTNGFLLKLIIITSFFVIPITITKLSLSLLLTHYEQMKNIVDFGSDIIFGAISIVVHVAIFTVFCVSYSRIKERKF